MPVDAKEIELIYNKYLGRGPDPEGLIGFSKYDSVLHVERDVVASDEFRTSNLILSMPRTCNSWKICILEEAKLIFIPIAKNAHTSILGGFLCYKGINWRKLAIPDELVRNYGNEDDKMHYVLARDQLSPV